MHPRTGHQAPRWEEWSRKGYNSQKKKGEQQRKRREKMRREEKKVRNYGFFHR